MPWRWLRLSLTVLLLLILVWFIDVPETLRQLRHTQWRWLLIALIVVQIQIVLSSLRWRITAIRLGQTLSQRRAIAEYYLATVANLSLPGGVTGDAVRVFRNQQSTTLGISLQAVMLERLAGQLALLVITLVGVTWHVLWSGTVAYPGWQIIAAGFSTILAFILISRFTIRFAPKRLVLAIQAFKAAINTAWISDRQWVAQSLISFAIAGTYLIVFWCCSHAIQSPLSVIQSITIVPMVLLSMMIPLSIGGWGIRESAAAVLWPVISLTAEAGIATSVLYAIVSLLGCLPGLLLLVLPMQPDHNKEQRAN